MHHGDPPTHTAEAAHAASPRCDEALSTTQNSRCAEGYGSCPSTCRAPPRPAGGLRPVLRGWPGRRRSELRQLGRRLLRLIDVGLVAPPNFLQILRNGGVRSAVAAAGTTARCDDSEAQVLPPVRPHGHSPARSPRSSDTARRGRSPRAGRPSAAKCPGHRPLGGSPGRRNSAAARVRPRRGRRPRVASGPRPAPAGLRGPPGREDRPRQEAGAPCPRTGSVVVRLPFHDADAVVRGDPCSPPAGRTQVASNSVTGGRRTRRPPPSHGGPPRTTSPGSSRR
jgi:hypothetical protein